jgi:predicted tellurium resistance membrane protein TerC
VPEILLDPKTWASFLTLTALEIVLGIDNLLFITIVSGRLPAERQPAARRVGLALAVITRLLLLFSIAFSVFVEALNLTAAKRRRARQDPAQIAPGG